MRFESSDFIEDITSSEIMLIDDLAKVNMILKEVRKVSGSQRVDPTLTKLSDLVRKWPDFTHSEKNTSFATNTCYELHLFLKHKDPAYFNFSRQIQKNLEHTWGVSVRRAGRQAER